METQNTHHHKSTLVIRLIGAFGLVKAAFLLVAGLGALHMVHHDLGLTAENLVRRFHVDPDGHFARLLISKLTGVTPARLREIGIAAFLYSAVFAVEGVGLVLAKRWAEWFTVVSASLLIPLEVYEIVRRPHWERIAILLINLAIVAYLIWRIRSDDQMDRSAKETARAMVDADPTRTDPPETPPHAASPAPLTPSPGQQAHNA